MAATRDETPEEKFEGKKKKIQEELIPIFTRRFGEDKQKWTSRVWAFLELIAYELTILDLIPSIETGAKQLEILLGKAFNEKYPPVQLYKELKDFVRFYRYLEEEAQAENQRLHSNASRGFYSSIKNQGVADPFVWFDDQDAALAGKGVMQFPGTVKITQPDEVVLLTPVMLVCSDNGSSIEEKKRQSEFLAKHLVPVLLNNDQGAYRVIVPVVSANSHWRLAIVNVQNGFLVKPAELWDPGDIKAKTALESMGAAVDLANKIIAEKKRVSEPASLGVVSLESAKLQKDGFRCLDYTLKKAYSMLNPAKLTVRAKRLLATEKPEAMRAEMIAAVIENVPEFTTRAQKLHACGKIEAAIDANQLSQLLRANQLPVSQFEFDELMAKKLNELFKKATKEKDEVLFKQAREYVMTQLLGTYSLFAGKAEARGIEAEERLESARANVQQAP